MPDPNDIYKLDEWKFKEPPDEEDLERHIEKQVAIMRRENDHKQKN